MRDDGSVTFERAPGHCHRCGDWCEVLLRRWNTIQSKSLGHRNKTDLCNACVQKEGEDA